MRCRGLHTLANPAYLAGFLCSALLSVAQYCVPGGVRVVSISLSPLPVTLSFTSSSIQSQSGKFFLVQLTINLRPRAHTNVDVAQCSRVLPSMRFWPAHFPAAGCGVRMLQNLRKVLKAPPVSRW